MIGGGVPRILSVSAEVYEGVQLLPLSNPVAEYLVLLLEGGGGGAG